MKKVNKIKELAKSKELTEESGYISYPYDWLTSFLYGLMRDGAPTGVVERIVRDIEEETIDEITYTNGWLAQYAKHLADRLRRKEK